MTMAASRSDFLAIGILDLLEADFRPTLVLDCFDFQDLVGHFRPILTNTAFQTLIVESPAYFEESASVRLPTPYTAFQEWAKGHTGQQARQSDTYEFAGLEWRQFDVSDRWRVISSGGSFPKDAPSLATRAESRQPTLEASSIEGHPQRKNLDWTTSSLLQQSSRHVNFIRACDWQATSVGAMNQWTFQLRSMMNMIMTDPLPAILFWGKDLICLYNEPYLNVAGSKHPELMGQSVTIGWADVWANFVSIFDKGRATGQATKLEDVLIFLQPAGGYTEESYLTFTVIPLLGEDGDVAGFYERVTDVTRQVLSQRRMNILLEISHLTSKATALKQYWQNLLASIESFIIDIPFAVLYSIDLDTENTSHGLPGSSSTYWIEGAVGIPRSSVDASFDAKDDSEVLAQVFRRAKEAGGHVMIDDRDECWPEHIVKDQDSKRGFGEVCNKASVYLLRPANGTVTRGLLILGLNRRQPYNEHHLLFRHTLGRQIASSLASIVLFEDEVAANKRRDKQAASDRALLSEELLQRARDTEILENRFFRIAQLSPVAIFVLNKDGSVIYANDKWYEFICISKSDRAAMAWVKSLWPEDIGLVDAEWSKMITQGVPIHFEFRVKKAQKLRTKYSANGLEDAPYLWVLGSAYPDVAEDGTFLSITGTLTDISQQKWAEVESEKKANEALESKRQQENFMDMVSHEIRNPLNAILQCADSIMTSLTNVDKDRKRGRQELLRECLDSAETIVHCAEHQKRIVDDILTLSKLDSNLLTVTPVPIQPAQLIRHALKLFHTQSQNARVALELELDPSLEKLDIDWVQLDPSRVLQIIINLLTNAIKFTASDGKGKVTIGLAASLYEPQGGAGDIQYFPSQEGPQGGTKGSNSEPLYLSFSIKDTGRGLSNDEQARLFNRFSQASPRTHIKYGGSGLGLYISRQLTELQGGKIGLASQADSGSVFAFFIRVERCRPAKALDVATENLMTVQISPSAESTLLFEDWLGGASILIVEDNLVNQRVLRKQLTPLVKETEVANNGVEALEFLRSTRYWHANAGTGRQLTAVLMDIEMPVMGGLACVKEIRRLQKEGLVTEHLLVIAVTANARMEQIKTYSDAGMDDVLTKPFKIKDLKTVLERAFRTWQVVTMSGGG